MRCMSNELEVLFTVHFVTFLLTEILILVPFFGWYLIRFAPARAYFLNAKYEHFLQEVAKNTFSLLHAKRGTAVPLTRTIISR